MTHFAHFINGGSAMQDTDKVNGIVLQYNSNKNGPHLTEMVHHIGKCVLTIYSFSDRKTHPRLGHSLVENEQKIQQDLLERGCFKIEEWQKEFISSNSLGILSLLSSGELSLELLFQMDEKALIDILNPLFGSPAIDLTLSFVSGSTTPSPEAGLPSATANDSPIIPLLCNDDLSLAEILTPLFVSPESDPNQSPRLESVPISPVAELRNRGLFGKTACFPAYPESSHSATI